MYVNGYSKTALNTKRKTSKGGLASGLATRVGEIIPTHCRAVEFIIQHAEQGYEQGERRLLDAE